MLFVKVADCPGSSQFRCPTGAFAPRPRQLQPGSVA